MKRWVKKKIGFGRDERKRLGLDEMGEEEDWDWKSWKKKIGIGRDG